MALPPIVQMAPQELPESLKKRVRTGIYYRINSNNQSENAGSSCMKARPIGRSRAGVFQECEELDSICRQKENSGCRIGLAPASGQAARRHFSGPSITLAQTGEQGGCGGMPAPHGAASACAVPCNESVRIGGNSGAALLEARCFRMGGRVTGCQAGSVTGRPMKRQPCR